MDQVHPMSTGLLKLVIPMNSANAQKPGREDCAESKNKNPLKEQFPTSQLGMPWKLFS